MFTYSDTIFSSTDKFTIYLCITQMNSGRRPKERKRIGMLSELKEDLYANMKEGVTAETPRKAGCQEGPVSRQNTRDV